MNIEHLVGKEIICIKDSPRGVFKESIWYKVGIKNNVLCLNSGKHFWALIDDELTHSHFDLANPRTPIGTENMVENYREMYNMLQELIDNFLIEPHAEERVIKLLTKSKLPQ